MKRTNENQNHFLLRTAVLLCVMMMTLFAPSKAWAGSTPAVQVETCEGGAGFIHVKGWAYDPDNQDYSLYVAISVYDKPKYNKLDTYLIKADIARTDVSALNGIPGNHGFETDIPLSAGTYYILFTVFNRNNEVKKEVIIDNVAVTAPLTGTVTLTSQSGIITLGNGATLTGTGGENTHVSIVDGATVTLSGVNISAIPDDRNHEWAGITCLGDATIILADETTNTVKSGDSFFAGIQVGPPGKTLTIRGNGSLLAQANGSCFGAGIGSSVFDASNDYDCGNIVIEGGNITAYGYVSPAIGAAQGSPCGTITVKGGTVYAESWGQASGIGSCNTKCGGIAITGGTVTAKSKYGPAIGSSTDGTCGNITISGGSVTATKGSSSRYSIGAEDNDCSCGTITIGSAVVDGVAAESFVYNSETTIYHVSFSKNANSATGTMADEIFFSSTAQPLNLCSFSLTGYNYLGWNTEADGSGTSYSDGQSITVTNDMTLFAQWGKIYTVTFNANKGSGSMAAQAYTESISQDLTANTFTRTGYDFAGWNTQADGNGTSYSDGQDITLANNMTLYAQWQPHAYNITYNLDAGTNDSSNPATYTIESDAITLADPTRFGFVFDGWTYEGQDTPTKSVTIAQGTYGDLTYTAHWTFNPIATITPETGYAELYDGHTLTGTGGTNTHIVIKDGAIVTLAGATITDIPDDNKHRWSGITCEGDATIILADGTTNNLKGGYWSFPGISVPENKTLTIQGSGTLYLSSNGHGPGIGPDNYGGGEGNITIEGGTIIATGGKKNAGIGGGEGNITITDGVTSVTATAGEEAPYSLGSGRGTVTIGGVVTDNIPQGTFTYNPSDRTPYTVTFDANGGEGSMDVQEFVSNTPKALTANVFTRTNHVFDGWNTKADGTGTNYSDGQTVINLGNVTLYARWWSTDVTRITTDTKEIELVDGDKIGGTGGNKTHVTIADGAVVKLCGVDITTITTGISSIQWAGITCLGDATIILEDGTTNAVKGGYHSAGITVPEGHTLTIKGNGSLTATGDSSAAGIGSGREGSCGNFIIEGGTITATGAAYAAGIGSGRNGTCGNIVIKGGTITATGEHSAGIGSGEEGSCGNIVIEGGTITATGDYSAGIGSGHYATCGNITIEGGNITANVSENTAAAIGCGVGIKGKESSCGDITITNGVTCVIATKKSSPSSNIIGNSGSYSTCGTITVGDGLTDKTVDKTRYITVLDWTSTTSVTLAKEGYGTYYGLFDLVLPAGMKAYIVTASADDGKLTYETIANGNTTNNIVPALTAVMLQTAAADGVQTFDVGITVPTVAAINQTNLLHGSEREKNTTGAGTGGKYYKLSYNTSGEDIGWYWGKPDGATFRSAANKAWLALPPTAAAREFFGLPDFEETSDIKHETLNMKHGDGEWYDLQGRKVANGQKPKAKGLYIVNGKKVVIK